MAFEKSLEQIRLALEADVKNKKSGLRISVIPENSILLHSQEKIWDLSNSLKETPNPQDLAAALLPLLHFMLKRKWTPEELDKRIVDILNERFDMQEPVTRLALDHPLEIVNPQ